MTTTHLASPRRSLMLNTDRVAEYERVRKCARCQQPFNLLDDNVRCQFHTGRVRSEQGRRGGSHRIETEIRAHTSVGTILISALPHDNAWRCWPVRQRGASFAYRSYLNVCRRFACP